jgi:hypothetical protein
VVPFLLANDHSILVVRSPLRKDVLPLLRLVMRRGLLLFRGQPIRVNLTLWMLVDVLPFIQRGAAASDKKPPKRMVELLTREYGVEFPTLFDMLIDIS